MAGAVSAATPRFRLTGIPQSTTRTLTVIVRTNSGSPSWLRPFPCQHPLRHVPRSLHSHGLSSCCNIITSGIPAARRFRPGCWRPNSRRGWDVHYASETFERTKPTLIDGVTLHSLPVPDFYLRGNREPVAKLLHELQPDVVYTRVFDRMSAGLPRARHRRLFTSGPRPCFLTAVPGQSSIRAAGV